MQFKPEKRLLQILQKYNSIPKEKYKNLETVEKVLSKNWASYLFRGYFLVLWCSILIAWVIFEYTNILDDSRCFLESPHYFGKIFREPEACDLCINVTSVDKIHNVTPEDFHMTYVTPARPVVVLDGATSWKALSVFNFSFFKELYGKEGNYDEKNTCQFFPYKTEFTSLEEVFQMSEERTSMKEGERPWYVGWSNCNNKAGKILRQYYSAPYFLSNMSENIALNWIFMGTPGKGAHMHVDNVRYPSWQAQLSGRKTWHLAPPPECYYKCRDFKVTVEPGEIIVLDTNRWYHQTTILPGNVSITIGSEFD